MVLCRCVGLSVSPESATGNDFAGLTLANEFMKDDIP